MRKPPPDWQAAIDAVSPDDLQAAANHLQANPADWPTAVDLANDLVRAPDRALALALALDRDLARDLVLGLARDRALALALDRDLDRALALGRDLALALGRDLALALDRDLARDRVLGLARDRALVRDLALGRDLALARASDLARDLARDLDLGRGLARDLDRDLASIREWAPEDVEPVHIWLAIYYRNLSAYLIVAWAASDEDEVKELVAVESLSAERVRESNLAFESTLGLTQRFIDGADPQELSKVDESFLRGQIETIKAQNRIVEGANSRIVLDATGAIVKRLLEIQVVGKQARSVLEQLGAEPEEVLQRILDEVTQAMAKAAEFTADSFDPAQDPGEAGEAIAAPAEAAEQVMETLEGVGQVEVWRKAIPLTIAVGMLEHIGAKAVDIGVTVAVGYGPQLLHLVTMALANLPPGIDAIYFSFVELLPHLRYIFTNYRDTKGLMQDAYDVVSEDEQE